MENEFIPYEQALALKELGFDEPCLAYYDMRSFTQRIPIKPFIKLKLLLLWV
jgi:hypothetical protein